MRVHFGRRLAVIVRLSISHILLLPATKPFKQQVPASSYVDSLAHGNTVIPKGPNWPFHYPRIMSESCRSLTKGVVLCSGAMSSRSSTESLVAQAG